MPWTEDDYIDVKIKKSPPGSTNWGHISGNISAQSDLIELVAAQAGGIPSGCILMWHGTIATIPTGWALCNGQNGTPDLRDKFIVGATQDDTGTAKTNITGTLTQSGGAASHHHADHTVTQPSAHTISSHAGAGVADHSSLTHSGAGVSAHAGATVADHAAHTHAFGTLAVAAHTVVSTKQGTASGNVVTTATHTVSGATANPSATLTHTVGQASNHTVTQPDAHGALTHTVTQAGDHTLSAHAGAGVSTHDTLASLPNYFALCYIMKT
jgi:hypothetical protein